MTHGPVSSSCEWTEFRIIGNLKKNLSHEVKKATQVKTANKKHTSQFSPVCSCVKGFLLPGEGRVYAFTPNQLSLPSWGAAKSCSVNFDHFFQGQGIAGCHCAVLLKAQTPHAAPLGPHCNCINLHCCGPAWWPDWPRPTCDGFVPQTKLRLAQS